MENTLRQQRQAYRKLAETVELVPWLEDADVMRAKADQSAEYFATAPYPVLGMVNPEFRIVHELGVPSWPHRNHQHGPAVTYFNSARIYRPADPDYRGDVINLGNTMNLADKQRGRMLARVLRKASTPARYAHYMTFEHTYEIIVD